MVISNVTGAAANGEELMTPRYWREHVRATVQFAAGVGSLIEHGCEAVIEIGATVTLLGLIAAMPESHRMLQVASLRKGVNDWKQLLTAAATLEVNGIDLDWQAFDAPYERRRVALPTYPFQRSRFWFDSDSDTTPAPPEEHVAAKRRPGARQRPGSGARLRPRPDPQAPRLRSLDTNRRRPPSPGAGRRLFPRRRLRHRLQRAFGDRLTLPMTLFFDYPTVDAVAAFVTEHVTAAPLIRSSVAEKRVSDAAPNRWLSSARASASRAA